MEAALWDILADLRGSPVLGNCQQMCLVIERHHEQVREQGWRGFGRIRGGRPGVRARRGSFGDSVANCLSSEPPTIRGPYRLPRDSV